MVSPPIPAIRTRWSRSDRSAALRSPTEVELYYQLSATFAISGEGGSGLTATGQGRISAPADRATVVVLPSISISSFSSPGAAAPAKSAVLEALTSLGVAEEDIDLNSNDPTLDAIEPGGGFVVKVDVDAGKLPDIGEEIADAVENVVGAAGPAGVIFASSDCTKLEAEAQALAVTDAEQRLEALAKSADIRTGQIAAVTATAGGLGFFPVPISVDACDPSSLAV